MPYRGVLWFVPGFLGSELYAFWPATGGRRKVWLDIPSLIRGDAANYLVWGQPPSGAYIVPGGLLDFQQYGYPGLSQRLQSFCDANQYQFYPWPYDWRRGALDLGAVLASQIIAAGSGLDHKILAHSYGGIVASAAMMQLFKTSQQNLVSAVVTLGTPFSGSYSPCRTFRLEEDSLNVFALFGAGGWAANPVNLLPHGIIWSSLNPPPGPAAFAQMFASWPAVYDLMPNPDLVDNPGDTYRSLVWDPANWSQAVAPPTAAMLTASQNGWQKAAQQGQAPAMSAWFLCVAGSGRDQTPVLAQPPLIRGGTATPGGTTLRDRQRQCPGISYSSTGDGTVNTDSALGVGRWGFWRITIHGADHTDLPTHPLIVNNLGKLLNLPAYQGWPRTTLTLPDGTPGPSTW
jgi:hypothetical protein